LDIRSYNKIATESVCSALIKEFTPLGLKYKLMLKQLPVFMNNKLVKAKNYLFYFKHNKLTKE